MCLGNVSRHIATFSSTEACSAGSVTDAIVLKRVFGAGNKFASACLLDYDLLRDLIYSG